MELKEYLNRGWGVYKKLSIKRAHLESLSNTISKYGEREIETYPYSNTSEAIMQQYSDMKAECEKLEKRLLKIDGETKALISRVNDPRYNEILYCRYVARLPWSQTAELMKYSGSYTYQLFAEALSVLEAELGYGVDFPEE